MIQVDVDPGQIGLGREATGDQARCYHGRRKCSFCRFPPKAAGWVRLRCACCGRFTKRAEATRCARCAERGYVALRLF